MNDILKLAFEDAAKLPDATQEHIGRELLEYIAAWHVLKEEIDKGLRDIEAGRTIPAEEGFAKLRPKHGAAA